MYMHTNYDTKEKMAEYLNRKKELLQKKLVGLYTLREFFPSLHGKIYNVRVRNAIDELPGLGCLNRNLMEIYLDDECYDFRQVLYLTDEVLDDSGKRLDNEKIQAKIREQLQEYRKEISEIDQDLSDGWERFQEILKIKQYYKGLFNKFSYPLRQNLQEDFYVKDYFVW